MNDNDKFIVKISCEPKIEPTDIGAKIVDKMLTLRVEKVNESVISQLRDLMKEKGINELYAIDESKVLEIVKKAQAFEIIKEKGIYWGIDYQPYEERNDYRAWDNELYESVKLSKEEYDLLKEVLEK